MAAAKSAKKTIAKPAAKKVAKKVAKPVTGAKKVAKVAKKRAPNPAFMKPMSPDAALAAIIGEKAVPRTEVTKKVWDYIKANDLQDKKNRRQINADDKLRPVFGGKSAVTMFEMAALIGKHLS